MLFFIGLIFFILLWIGIKLTGAILKALIWLCFGLPCAIILAFLGIMCICTVILMPVGFSLLRSAGRILIPG